MQRLAMVFASFIFSKFLKDLAISRNRCNFVSEIDENEG